MQKSAMKKRARARMTDAVLASGAVHARSIKHIAVVFEKAFLQHLRDARAPANQPRRDPQGRKLPPARGASMGRTKDCHISPI